MMPASKLTSDEFQHSIAACTRFWKRARDRYDPQRVDASAYVGTGLRQPRHVHLFVTASLTGSNSPRTSSVERARPGNPLPSPRVVATHPRPGPVSKAGGESLAEPVTPPWFP